MYEESVKKKREKKQIPMSERSRWNERGKNETEQIKMEIATLWRAESDGLEASFAVEKKLILFSRWCTFMRPLHTIECDRNAYRSRISALFWNECHSDTTTRRTRRETNQRSNNLRKKLQRVQLFVCAIRTCCFFALCFFFVAFFLLLLSFVVCFRDCLVYKFAMLSADM